MNVIDLIKAAKTRKAIANNAAELNAATEMLADAANGYPCEDTLKIHLRNILEQINTPEENQGMSQYFGRLAHEQQRLRITRM